MIVACQSPKKRNEHNIKPHNLNEKVHRAGSSWVNVASAIKRATHAQHNFSATRCILCVKS